MAAAAWSLACMNAAEAVARLSGEQLRCLPADKLGDHVVDLCNVRICVQEEYADLGSVEDGLQNGLFANQLLRLAVADAIDQRNGLRVDMFHG